MNDLWAVCHNLNRSFADSQLMPGRSPLFTFACLWVARVGELKLSDEIKHRLTRKPMMAVLYQHCLKTGGFGNADLNRRVFDASQQNKIAT